ncbi:MAG: CHASE2 domain-containing protein [Treponema sp.]|nr:CHASE2 domain-containing protein [Treponema sp.]
MKNNVVFNKRHSEFFVVLGSVIVCTLLWLSGSFRKIDYKLYDFLLPFTKEIKSDDSLLLVEIDDFAIEQVGDWPWTRDIMGNALLRMKELGAERVVFDIEYLSPASLSLNLNAQEKTNEIFNFEAQSISEGLNNFSRAIYTGQIPLKSLDSASDQFFSNSILPSIISMKNATDSMIQDNDDYFSRCLQFFGNSWLTINMQSMGVNRSEEEQAYAKARFGLKIVSDPKALIPLGNAEIKKLEAKASNSTVENMAQYLTPAVSPIINAASGASFTNCFVDLDGTRRRIQLIESTGDSYIGQLAFAPLVNLLDVQEIRRESSKLVLEGAKYPGESERKNINIPLDDTGCMLINWLHSTYIESFGGNLGNVKENRHESLAFLTELDRLEEYLADNLSIFAGLDFLPEYFYGKSLELSSAWHDMANLKKSLLSTCKGFDVDGNAIGGGISESLLNQYFELRRMFFADLAALVNNADFDTLGQLYGDDMAELCDSTKSLWETYTAYEADMSEKYKGAFCLVGFTASASTDFGIMPFDRIYANLGVHANVANTILQNDFIKPLSALWGFAFALLLVLIVVFAGRKSGVAHKIAFGLFYVFADLIIFVILMTGFKIFIPSALSLFFVLFCFIGNTVINFIQLEKDRSTLKRGFDAYVAPEVVSQIVKNPEKLRLGGVNTRLTALFSDVRKFSGFTECVNREEGEEHGAERLVAILNDYLGLLSNAIMSQKGTIDKYVGDEIVSFFGAPVANPDNAFDACVAGIRMKQAEDIYNTEHAAELPIHPKTGTPFLLKSRVGLNTGDMVVGNMGTEKKLNYTVMGNNVNLASRLEGTNKEYDSWIIASESTWNDANRGENEGKLIARQLDCVKVINVEKPVQIYSIVGLRSELSAAEIEASDIFNSAMEFYLKGRETPDQPKNPDDFKKAIELFEKAYNCFHTSDPQDPGFISMEKKMILRCNEYLKNGIPKIWDGVYTMTTK